MRHRRRERGVLSTRQLMGIEQIKDCYIQTAHGDLIFFIIQPTNISVLPQAGIEARILSLLNVLRSQQEVELLAMNSRESCNHLDGCFADLMAGYYKINMLEPKSWGGEEALDDPEAPEAFRKKTRLAQHISFLKDFFRSYKHFEDAHIDTIEIMLGKLYARFGITEQTDFQKKKPTDYPILSDLYDLIAEEYHSYDSTNRQLYSQELLQEILLGLHSMCKGSDSQFFNGHTNVTSHRFLVFGVKGLITVAENVKNAMLFNILSYMTDQLLNAGNTVAALDELYIWLSNLTTITYIRNALKRVRKKESAIVMASQNLEDFDQEGVRELTRPLFSIPPHQFLFNPGSISPKAYMDMLQLEPAEFELIKYPHNGHCLYKCGNERYHLQVIAPEYKRVLFGEAGGR